MLCFSFKISITRKLHPNPLSWNRYLESAILKSLSWIHHVGSIILGPPFGTFGCEIGRTRKLGILIRYLKTPIWTPMEIIHYTNLTKSCFVGNSGATIFFYIIWAMEFSIFKSVIAIILTIMFISYTKQLFITFLKEIRINYPSVISPIYFVLYIILMCV